MWIDSVLLYPAALLCTLYPRSFRENKYEALLLEWTDGSLVWWHWCHFHSSLLWILLHCGTPTLKHYLVISCCARARVCVCVCVSACTNALNVDPYKPQVCENNWNNCKKNIMYAVYIKTGYFRLSHISTLFILNNPYFTLSSYLKKYNMCI
jgi:hypothetical protein